MPMASLTDNLFNEFFCCCLSVECAVLALCSIISAHAHSLFVLHIPSDTDHH